MENDENDSIDDEVITQKMIDSWFEKKPNHGFAEIAGMKDVKKKMERCLQIIEWNKVRKRLKMSTVQSFFFVGPPGCGKTYIAEAFTYELMERYHYKYMYLSGADIHSRYVGDAEKIVKKAFEVAAQNAPCIMFIDEFDSVCRNRSASNLPEHVMSTTNAFLNAFSKLKSTVTYEKPVIFVAATNYPQNVDGAMLDRVELIPIFLPDEEAREHAFERKLEEMDIPYELDCAEIAEITEKYNYRDIDRMMDAIKDLFFDQLKDNFVMEKDALDMIEDKTFVISKEMFDEVCRICVPSPKDEILQELENWLSKLGNYNS